MEETTWLGQPNFPEVPMSAEERERHRAWHRTPSMSELLASCVAADAVSTPPGRDRHQGADGDRVETPGEPRPLPRRDAA